MLIDRVNYLDEQLPWKLNKDIIHHLRMAMVLFEARALIRKQEKNFIAIEKLPTSFDGHLKIKGE